VTSRIPLKVDPWVQIDAAEKDRAAIH